MGKRHKITRNKKMYREQSNNKTQHHEIEKQQKKTSEEKEIKKKTPAHKMGSSKNSKEICQRKLLYEK